jgi:hypothetical protein
VGVGSSLYVQNAGELLEVTSAGDDFNYQPVLSGTAETQVEAGKGYQFKPTASDADQDALTFSIVNAPSWATFDAETGELKGTPTAEDLGVTNAIEISASDGRLTTRLPAFNLSVNVSVDSNSTPTTPPTTPPTISPIVSPTPTPQPTDVTRGKTLGTAPPPINFSGGKKGIRISGDTNSSMLKGNDFIYGNKKNNNLSGMEGNDHIFGKQGERSPLGRIWERPDGWGKRG